MRMRLKIGNSSQIASICVLDHVEAAALAVGVVLVDAGADDELALVGLADIDVDGVGHDHAGEHRLDRLRHQGLQRVAFERQADAGHVRHHAGMAGGDEPTLLGPMKPARRLDADDRPDRRGGCR